MLQSTNGRGRRTPGARALIAGAISLAGALAAADARAGDASTPNSTTASPDATVAAAPPSSPAAPLGIYGAGLTEQGHFVVGVLPSFVRSAGSLIGTQSVTPQYAGTNVYTTFSPKGVGVKQLVRNDPLDVSIWSESVGVSYGLTRDFTISAGASILQKHQDVLVFQGTKTGTAVQGISSAGTQGLGDSSVVGLYRLYQDAMNLITVHFGLSLPTGSTTATENVFNNTSLIPATKRAVYTLQLGTGTVDAIPGVTYKGVYENWSWGLAYRGRMPLDSNNQGYRWGNYNEADIWGGYAWLRGLTTTLRVMGNAQGAIRGWDPNILGYGPCSNPLWFGGEHVDLLPGLTVSGRFFGVPAATLAMEFDIPLYQNLNGLHTARDYGVMTGLKYKF